MRNGAFIPAVEAQRRNARVSYVKRDWQDECRRADVYFVRSFIVVNSLGLAKFRFVRHAVREFIIAMQNLINNASKLNLFSEDEAKSSSKPDYKNEIIELACDNLNLNNLRADVFIAKSLGVTRAYAQKLIKAGCAEKIKKSSQKVILNNIYKITLPEPENDFEIEPEEVKFEVIYEDKDIIVLNKPAGLVTHPGHGNWHGTLAHGLLYKYPDMKLLRNKLRPGIVHRLDAVTSGLMVAARTQAAYEILQKKFQERAITKKYLALAHGVPVKNSGILSGAIGRDPDNKLKMAVIDETHGGKAALTGYEVIRNYNNKFSLIICSLFTGRTHQIRVHLSALGHALYADSLYGAPKHETLLNNRIFLHSWRLEFNHPVTNKFMKFCLPLPDELKNILQDLK